MACYISLVFLLGFPAVYSGSYTLKYYITMLSTAYPGLPQYSVIAYVDDVRYGRYNSDTRHAEFLIQSLMVLSEHLDGLNKQAQLIEITQKALMNFIMDSSNKTYDINHVFQTKAACVLHEDGTVDVYKEEALDGKQLIVFDKETMEIVPATGEAAVLAQWLNKQAYPKKYKISMENECTQHLPLYLLYIKNYLDKKVPNVKLSGSESENGTELHCRVYGFYPRDVEVKWIKNGRDEIHSEEAAQILPNPDGTYQISVGVKPEGGATYSCHIDHSSLEKALVVPFEKETKNSHITYILIAVGVIVLFLAFRLGFFYKKKVKGFQGSRQSANTNEQ
ncbi:zinc-alpha-2-glycoprotein-like [Xenopus tropicalis]|uniref:Zinc-alpha-2-glycoprotein-like n=1 Tax=Xenopus tropicalis TaxID=8364 RepID=A0A8J0S5P6_XENTR|nr:zinc-alpha-2-glycoprotein-like [Xenopus tropicalis]|eukprot:XP_012808707.1 PREDICTED: zinc-alpha-2-glycoprotein-like [Xenopus tropicalis]